MASIWKHPKSQYWTACFTDGAGRQLKRSTRVTDRKKAQTMAEGYERAYRMVLTEAQARRVVADIFEQVNGRPLNSSNVRDFFVSWLEGKQKEASGGTYVRYENVVQAFLAFMGERAEKDLNYVTPSDVTKFRNELSSRLSSASVNLYVKILRSAFKSAWMHELIKENPAAKVSGVNKGKAKGKGGSRRAFTADELHRILAVADDEWRGLILFGLYTGQRLGDLARLTWRSLDIPNRELILRTEKTDRNMVVPLAKPLVEFIQGMRVVVDSPDAPLFPASFETLAGGRIGTLSNRFYAILVEAGLAEERSRDGGGQGRSGARSTQPLSFHSLRHTATSMLKNAGVSESVVMDIIGHESAAVSRQYTHIDLDAKRKAMDRMPSLTLPGAREPRS